MGKNCEQAGTETTNQPCGGPEIRKSSQLTLATSWRWQSLHRRVRSMTRGVNAGFDGRIQARREAPDTNLPVLTSTPTSPNSHPMTASSPRSSRQYVTCWPWLIAKPGRRFLPRSRSVPAHEPDRSFHRVHRRQESVVERYEFGGDARRLTTCVEYFSSGAIK